MFNDCTFEFSLCTWLLYKIYVLKQFEYWNTLGTKDCARANSS